MNIKLKWLYEKDVENMCIRIELLKADRAPIGFTLVDSAFSGKAGEEKV